MSDIDLAGGCQCGTVRYRVTAAAKRTFHCHCSMCRKLHGAIFVTFSTVPEDGFAIEHGEESIGRFESSSVMRRSFCTGCGCQIYSQWLPAPGLIYLATGTLDEGAFPGPSGDYGEHVWVGSKVPWFEITDGRPQFEEEPPD